MERFPKILGYAGALPFLILLPLIYLTKGKFVTGELTVGFNFIYALFIICFMAGAHWVNAIKSQDKVYMFLSIAPVLAAIILAFTHSYFESPLILIGCSFIFFLVYLMDRKYYRPSQIPEGYLTFRRNLTILVCALLTAGAFLGIEY